MAQPTVTPPAPAATPAPKPAATPPAAAAATPKPAEAPKTDPTADEIVSDFDKLDAQWDSKVKKAAGVEDKPADDPDETKPSEEDKPAEEKPKVEKKEEPAKADKQVVTGPKQLREELERVKRESSDVAKERDELRSKIADADKKGKDVTALSEQLAAKAKEAEELQSTIRMLKQEASPEFKEKYEKPFQEAANDSAVIFNQLEITDTESGETRTAKWEEDFAPIYNLPYPQARQRAKEMFGDDAGLVMDYYNSLHRLQRQRDGALAQEKEKWKERQEAETASRAQEQSFIQETWPKINQTLVEKRPEWFGEDPEDPEGNELFKKGLSLVDEQPKTLQDRMIKDATIRLRAAGFRRMVHRVEKANAKIAELEAELKEFRESLPGKTQRAGSGEGGTDAPKSFKDDLKETMANAG